MRIGIVCHASYGGSSRVAVELSKQLARRGHNVCVLARVKPPHFDPKTDGITCHTLFNGDDPLGAPATLLTHWPHDDVRRFQNLAADAVRRYNLDVLHFHYAIPFAAILSTLDCRRQDKNRRPLLVGTLHGTDVPMKTAANTASSHTLARHLNACDHLTTVSASHAQLAKRTLNLKTAPTVLYNFIDLDDFKPVASSKNNHHPPTPEKESLNPLKLIHVSNYRPVKNTPRVARIFRRFAQTQPATLTLIGDGPQKAQTLASLGSARALTTSIGLCENVSNHLRNAHVFVLTSHHESFGMVCLEAFACGLPVLAHETGGVPELVHHDHNGFLFTTNEQALAALSRLSHPQTYARLRQGALETARQFDAKHRVAHYETLYQQHTAQRPHTQRRQQHPVTSH